MTAKPYQFSILLCLFISLFPAVASAQTPQTPVNSCQEQITSQLSFAHVQYRYALYGQKPANQEPINAVRIDPQLKTRIKTGPDRWVLSGTDPMTDAEMEQGYLTNRRGIFERTGARTSDLLPDIVQSYRSFNCFAAAVCKNAQLTMQDAKRLRKEEEERIARDPSLPPLSGDWVPIRTPGCDRIDVSPLTSCHEVYGKNDVSQMTALLSFCQPAAEAMMQREADLLKLAVAYDAAYRSLLQFAGTFDRFIVEFKGDITTPIEQAVSVIGHLNRIPCFLSQCNE